jgi:hypothetical protein
MAWRSAPAGASTPEPIRRGRQGGIVASGPAGEDVVYARGLDRDGVGVLARLRYPATRPEGEAWGEALDASLRWTE